MEGERHFLGQLRFSRGLSLWQAMARGLGVVLSAAVLTLLGEAVQVAGPLLPLAFLLAALLAVINGLGYAELAVGVPRSGGAYTLVHEGHGGGGLAFLTGWSLALASLGFCGLLAQGAAQHLGLLLSDLLGVTVPVGMLGVGLVALATLESSLGWRAGRRIPFTLPTVALLGVLGVLAVRRLPSLEYPTAAFRPGPALALLFAAFVGLEAITDHQGEIRRRSADLPRALLGAPMLAAALGAGLAAGTGPWVAEGGGTPLAPVGEAVAGAAGREMVLALGTLILFLSLNRALTTLVRLLYGMSRDGYWPTWLRWTHPRRGVPIRLVLLVGLLTAPAVWLPADVLGRVSGLLYLLVLMAVNLTLTLRSRRGPRPAFALPFHPWIPALTLVVDLLVIPLWGLTPALWAAGGLAVGGLIYLAYGRVHHIEAQEGVIVFRPPGETRAPADFRVLVPVANPATEATLLRLASHLARLHGGEVLALQVVVVPESLPLEAGRQRARSGRALLERALALADEEGLPIQTMTRVARSVAQGILDAAAEEGADLILLGWEGPTRSRPASPGPIVDSVLRGAPCDVLVVQGEVDALPKRILVPTAGGSHARAAARLALSLAESLDGEVTLLCVQPGPVTRRQVEEGRCRIEETLKGLTPARPPRQKVVTASSVIEGIVREAQEYDLVLMGVSEESLLDRILFGDIPLQVAARVPKTVLVQGDQGLTGLWTRRLLRALRDLLPVLGDEERLEVQQELTRDAQPGANYFVLTVLSCVIAALGLLLDSPAVVIGAMLVAPLMSPILAFSLGLVLGDLRLIRFSTEAIFKGVSLAVLIALLIGFLSPLKEVTSEMLARARPNLLDMAVALASGMAGAYALARKDVSAALPGVAIAAALMPPLATVGVGLAMGDVRVAGGAFLLFVTNIAAISLAGGVVFLLLGIRPHVWGPESRRRLWRRLTISLLLLAVIAVPLGLVMVGTVRDAAQERAIREALAQALPPREAQVTAVEVRQEETTLAVVVTLRSTRSIDRETADDLAGVLSERLGRPVNLEITVLPTIHAWGR